jgi:hypothetical protein
MLDWSQTAPSNKSMIKGHVIQQAANTMFLNTFRIVERRSGTWPNSQF